VEDEMKKFVKQYKSFKGQVIPLVALMMFAIIAMVMLILDGGTLLSYRRTAQAAADAGAMAGAQVLCWDDLTGDPEFVAESYATNNGATIADAVADGYMVKVTATVSGDSFFARVFGVNELKATAEAIASCNGVRGKGVIPLAWHCEPNVIDIDDQNPVFDPALGCKQQALDWKLIGDFVKKTVDSVAIKDSDGNSVTYHRYNKVRKDGSIDSTSLVDDPAKIDSPPIPPEQIYIMFDAGKLEDRLCHEDHYKSCTYDDDTHEILYCTTFDDSKVDPLIEDLAGDYQCDLDGDGKLDISLGGERGSVYLTSEDSSLIKWITADTQPDITLRPHVWLTADSGVGAIVNKMDSFDWSGKVVLIPVYNYYCQDNPESNEYCTDDAHNPPYVGEGWPEWDSNKFPTTFDLKKGGSLWFHIVSFQPFYISCVDSGGECPGYRYAQELNPTLGDNVDVVEGYFLSEYDDTSTDGFIYCDPLQNNNCDISLRKNDGE